MLSILSNLRITYRIYLLIALVAVGIGVIYAQSVAISSRDLFQERTDQTRRLVEASISLINNYVAEAQKDGVDLADAQKRALKRLASMRYDGKEYFWVQTMDSKMVMHPTKPEMNGTDISTIKDGRWGHDFQGYERNRQNKRTGRILLLLAA